jgi:hypothetical protein
MATTDQAAAPPEPVVEGSWTAPLDAQTSEVRARLILALARVRWLPVEAIQGKGGDLRIDSQEAEVAISMLEIESGLELAKVEDLRRDELATIGSLTRLIHGKLIMAAGNVRKEGIK